MRIEQVRRVEPGSSVTVSNSTPTLLVPYNKYRYQAIVQNNDGAIVIKVGSDSFLTAGNGIPVAAGDLYVHYGASALYGKAASGSPAMGVVDVTGDINYADRVDEANQTITTPRKLVLPKDTKRLYATLHNLDGSNPIWIGNKAILAAGGGIKLAAGKRITIPGAGEWWAVAGGTSEVQRFTITGTLTAGSYTATYGGFASTIAFDADAAAIQTALELNPLLKGNVTVSGTGPFDITFKGELAAVNVAQFTIDNTNLTGGTVAASTTTPGSANSISLAVRQERRAV